MARAVTCVLGAASIAAAGSVAGAAGQLDPAFANGAVGAPGLEALRIPLLAVSRDGRILLSGPAAAGSFGTLQWGVARTFDETGLAIDGFAGSQVSTIQPPIDAAAFDAAGRALIGGTKLLTSTSGGGSIQRLRSDGQVSTTFTPTMPSASGPAQSLQSLFALAVDAAGRIAGGGSTILQSSLFYPSGQGPAHSVVVARHRDGTPDIAFGDQGEVVLESPEAGVDARVRALGFDSHGIVVAHGTANRIVLQRLLESGTIDATFGNLGTTIIDGWRAVVVDRSGRAVVLAGPDDNRTLVRYVDGRPDSTFASAVPVPLSAPYRVLATDAGGAVYVARVAAADGVATLRMQRVRADGIVDATYGNGGEATASFDYGPNGGASDPALAVDDVGRLIVAAMLVVRDCLGLFCQSYTVPMLYRFTGASIPPTTTLAVEYHHAGMDHYFTTADTDEITGLDAGVFEGWSRTGETFAVAARSLGEASPACRFFSGSTFAPKGSHFYTPYPGECDIADASTEWGFEKIAYLLRVPDGVGTGDGTCPAGLRPLYRAFNRMRGGAPNHRYTTSVATLDAMLAQGWQLEGEANTRVFACVPS